uniref:Uncharacterized protein n=1 Tax=Rhodopseudomonas palustris (strain BisA53) TaxID=316055 RepID=Q07PC9_RHOP5
MAAGSKLGFIIAAALTASCSAALAQQGSDAQREACTPDAFRLCGQFIPDANRIEGCLRAAGPRLSPACYVVFYPPEPTRQKPRMVRRQWTAED